MKKNYETGHAKNVENFSKLDQIVRSLGAKYAPGDARLQPSNLNTIKTSAAAALETVNLDNPPYLKALSRREAAFDGIPKLASRALAIAETLHLDPATINALKELVRKLYGRRAAPKKVIPENPGGEATGEEHKYVSVSRLSFDQRIEHFSQFIDILAAEPAYQPAEQELGIPNLSGRLAEMRVSNTAVTQASIPLSNARNNRNDILYAPLSGLVDIALDVKKYVRAAFGDKSAEYKEIKSLEFTRPKT